MFINSFTSSIKRKSTPLFGLTPVQKFMKLSRSIAPLALDLIFLGSNALDPRITYTRSGVATIFNSNGLLETLSANQPRLDYNPDTLQPKGLLIEESRTNLLLYSRDMTNAVWLKTDVNILRNQLGIDGATNAACLVTEGSLNSAILVQQVTVVAGSTITYSQILKRGNTDWVRISLRDFTLTDGANGWFNLSTGTIGAVSSVGAGTNNSSKISSLGGGRFLCSITTTPNGTYTVASGLTISATSDVSGTRVSNATYIIDCAQLEVGAFPTSYIPTTSSAVTRSVDLVVMTGTNFSSWWNAMSGTYLVEGSRFGFDNVGGSVALIEADDGTAANRIALRITPRLATAAAQATVVTSSVVQCNDGYATASDLTNVKFKYSMSYQAGLGGVTKDGLVTQSINSGTLPSVSQFSIGSYPSAVALNGHIRSIRYYASKLTNAQLQTLTT
jgi:hypothetical protein